MPQIEPRHKRIPRTITADVTLNPDKSRGEKGAAFVFSGRWQDWVATVGCSTRGVLRAPVTQFIANQSTGTKEEPLPPVELDDGIDTILNS